MAEGQYNIRTSGPTKGGCTREAYLGGGVRAYIGKSSPEATDMPSYLRKEDKHFSVSKYAGSVPAPAAPPYNGATETIATPEELQHPQRINTSLPMVNSCRGTCRTEIGCTCKGTQ